MPTSSLTPEEFIHQISKLGLSKGYIVYLNDEIKISNPTLNPLVDFLKNSPDYHQHEGIFFEIDTAMNCSYWAFVHNTHRGQAQGGTRLFSYATIANLISDGLRLAEGMTYKNALAHLWWGGGKGIINIPPPCEGEGKEGVKGQHITPQDRTKIMTNYGRFVASLNGCYVTAEDMNTNTEDMRIIHAHCRHCTCLPMDIGGSGNPSPFTARGVQKAMEAAVHFLENKNSTLKDKHIAVQGAGNVGYPLIENLIKAQAHLTVADASPDTRQKLRDQFSKDQITVLEPSKNSADPNKSNVDIGNRPPCTQGGKGGVEKLPPNTPDPYTLQLLSTDCDILSPCAIGAILSAETIPFIKAKIIAGAANNQLKNPVQDSETLHKKNILYVPDYVINRMGIVNCANEMYGYLISDIATAVEQVYPDTLHILAKAKTESVTPFAYADIWAKEESLIDHPIWGHRGQKIIEQLIKDGWGKN